MTRLLLPWSHTIAEIGGQSEVGRWKWTDVWQTMLVEVEHLVLVRVGRGQLLLLALVTGTVTITSM